MGEPKFSRRKYARPMNPWEAQRIKDEDEIVKKYGIKNKKELWRAEAMLRAFRDQSKDLQARIRVSDLQAQKEKQQLLERLTKLSVLPENGTLDDVLGLNIESILSRRLQTLVYLKGFASTPGQARQLIVHGHTCINGRKVTIPGYLVKLNEESSIMYNPKSPLSNELHPARPKTDQATAAPPPPPPEPAAPQPSAPQPAVPAPQPAVREEPAAKPEKEPKKPVNEDTKKA